MKPLYWHVFGTTAAAAAVVSVSVVAAASTCDETTFLGSPEMRSSVFAIKSDVAEDDASSQAEGSKKTLRGVAFLFDHQNGFLLTALHNVVASWPSDCSTYKSSPEIINQKNRSTAIRVQISEERSASLKIVDFEACSDAAVLKMEPKDINISGADRSIDLYMSISNVKFDWHIYAPSHAMPKSRNVVVRHSPKDVVVHSNYSRPGRSAYCANKKGRCVLFTGIDGFQTLSGAPLFDEHGRAHAFIVEDPNEPSTGHASHLESLLGLFGRVYGDRDVSLVVESVSSDNHGALRTLPAPRLAVAMERIYDEREDQKLGSRDACVLEWISRDRGLPLNVNHKMVYLWYTLKDAEKDPGKPRRQATLDAARQLHAMASQALNSNNREDAARLAAAARVGYFEDIIRMINEGDGAGLLGALRRTATFPVLAADSYEIVIPPVEPGGWRVEERDDAAYASRPINEVTRVMSEAFGVNPDDALSRTASNDEFSRRLSEFAEAALIETLANGGVRLDLPSLAAGATYWSTRVAESPLRRALAQRTHAEALVALGRPQDAATAYTRAWFGAQATGRSDIVNWARVVETHGRSGYSLPLDSRDTFSDPAAAATIVDTLRQPIPPDVEGFLGALHTIGGETFALSTTQFRQGSGGAGLDAPLILP